ncbi:MAG: GNAT family N-acetyltransferase [Pseudomonadota bacterium]
MMDTRFYPKVDLNTYQKKTTLKDGTKITLRPMVPEDKDALYEFFKGVDKEVARYLRDDVGSRLVIDKWSKNLDYEKTLPILAVKNGAIIADATINRRQFGWKWHLGTVRIFVHRDYRNRGLGRVMIDELVDVAYKLGIEKLVAEIPDLNTAAVNAFTEAGFHRVALIPNMAKDRENRPVALVVVMKDVRPAQDEEYDYDF